LDLGRVLATTAGRIQQPPTPCRLLKLPPELRVGIYACVIDGKDSIDFMILDKVFPEGRTAAFDGRTTAALLRT